MDYKRARTDSQVEDRMNEIVGVAIKIYEENGLGKINFLAISKHTQFTRPAIYKYFKTKEELILKMIVFYAKKVSMYVEEHIGKLQNNETSDVADVFTDAFCQVPEFMDLYTILFSKIKKNVSGEALVQFKKEINDIKNELQKIIKKIYIHKTDEDVQSFVVFYLAFASGLYSMLDEEDEDKQGTAQMKANDIYSRFEQPFKSALMIYLQNLKEG